MAKPWILCALSSILVFSCRIPEREVPSDIINDSLMRVILLDVYLAEGGRSGGQRMFDDRVISDYYEMIFEKHKIDSASFSRSFDFYSSYPLKMAAIHEKIVRRLMEIDAQKAAIADSARLKLQENRPVIMEEEDFDLDY